MMIVDTRYAQQMANMHINALPESFLASLGVKFLSLVYELLISDPEIITIGEFKGSKLIGFVAAGGSLKRIYVKLLFKPLLVFRSLAWNSVRFNSLRGIFEVIIYSFCTESTKRKNVNAKRTIPELYLIAVESNYQRLGIASNLLQELIDYFVEQGTMEFKVLVGEELEIAKKFYEKHGLTRRSRIVHHGKYALEYTKEIL